MTFYFNYHWIDPTVKAVEQQVKINCATRMLRRTVAPSNILRIVYKCA